MLLAALVTQVVACPLQQPAAILIHVTDVTLQVQYSNWLVLCANL